MSNNAFEFEYDFGLIDEEGKAGYKKCLINYCDNYLKGQISNDTDKENWFNELWFNIISKGISEESYSDENSDVYKFMKYLTENEGFSEERAQHHINAYREQVNKASGGAFHTIIKDIKTNYRGKRLSRFIYEFIQNADDCIYDSVKPDENKLHITLDIHDAAKHTIKFVYNENGFMLRDLLSITDIGDSTKAESDTNKEDYNQYNKEKSPGVFYNERTGRKGIGFKSVFALYAKKVTVHIYSRNKAGNVYSFRMEAYTYKDSEGKEDLFVLPSVWENYGLEDEINAVFGKEKSGTCVLIELESPEPEMSDVYNGLDSFWGESNESGNMPDFFAECPVLFLRRLGTVIYSKIDNDIKKTVEIKSSWNKPAYDDDDVLEIGETDIKTKLFHSGIKIDDKYIGTYKQKGKLTIKNSSNDRTESAPREIDVCRMILMIEAAYEYNNYSIMAPIIYSEKNEEYKKGSLYRTFPMIKNKFDIPFAIDAPFTLKEDRSDVEKTDELKEGKTGEWNKTVFNNITERLIPEFISWIQTDEEIKDTIRMDLYMDIDKYGKKNGDENTPQNKENSIYSAFFKKCKLRSQADKNTLIPLENAKILFPTECYDIECYDFINKDKLQTFFEVFSDDKYKLISKEYADKDRSSLKLDIFNSDFTNHMNAFVRQIIEHFDGLCLRDNADENRKNIETFFYEHLYSFFRTNYETIFEKDKNYTKLEVLYYNNIEKNKDGRFYVVPKTCGTSRTSFIKNEGKTKSFDNNRWYYIVLDKYEENESWINELLGNNKIHTIKEEFESDNFSDEFSWDNVILIISALCYYSSDFDGWQDNKVWKIEFPYLKNYAFTEDVEEKYGKEKYGSKSENRFRTGYLKARKTNKTGDKNSSPEILKGLITQSDIDEIYAYAQFNDTSEKQKEKTKAKIFNLIKSIGLRENNDFFELEKSSKGKNSSEECYCLDSNTKALLTSYGKDDLDDIKNIAKNIADKRKDLEKVSIKYEELKRCNPLVFLQLIENSLCDDNFILELCNGISLDSEEAYKAFLKSFCLAFYDESKAKWKMISGEIEKKYISKEKEIITFPLYTVVNNELYDLVRIYGLFCLKSENFSCKIKYADSDIYDIQDYEIRDNRLEYFLRTEKNNNVSLKACIRNNDSADDSKYIISKHKNGEDVVTEVLFFCNGKNDNAAEDAGGLYSYLQEIYPESKLWLDGYKLKKKVNLESIGEKESYIRELKKLRWEEKRLYEGKDSIQSNRNNYQDKIQDFRIEIDNEKQMMFVMPELFQNINDCGHEGKNKYCVLDVQFKTDKEDKLNYMKLTYDEKGFENDDVYYITSLGESLKREREKSKQSSDEAAVAGIDENDNEKEGEKGLGFKKVFYLFDKVRIFSNGYYFELEYELGKVETPMPPRYIEPSEYAEEVNIANSGKTVMEFEISHHENYANDAYSYNFRTEKLEEIKNSLKILVADKVYNDRQTSPIYLKNIDEIHIDGEDCCYSREEINKIYKISKEFPLKPGEQYRPKRSYYQIAFPKITHFSEIQNGGSDIFIAGFFYSTLPIDKVKVKGEQNIPASITINIPWELKDDRDDIKLNGYNKALFNYIFGKNGCFACQFKETIDGLLEEPEFFLPAYTEHFIGFLSSVNKLGKNLDIKWDKSRIMQKIAEIKAFKSFDGQKVSLMEGYILPKCFYEFNEQNKGYINEAFYEIFENYHLIDVSSEQYDAMKSFVSRVIKNVDEEIREGLLERYGRIEKDNKLIDDFSELINKIMDYPDINAIPYYVPYYAEDKTECTVSYCRDKSSVFFLSEDEPSDDTPFSSYGNYHIFAGGEEFADTLGISKGKECISGYLLDRMKQCTEFNEEWIKYAFDLLRVYDDESDADITIAIEGIKTNDDYWKKHLLMIPDNIGKSIESEDNLDYTKIKKVCNTLIELSGKEIFIEVLTYDELAENLARSELAKTPAWSKVNESDINAFYKMLVKMGVSTGYLYKAENGYYLRDSVTDFIRKQDKIIVTEVINVILNSGLDNTQLYRDISYDIVDSVSEREDITSIMQLQTEETSIDITNSAADADEPLEPDEDSAEESESSPNEEELTIKWIDRTKTGYDGRIPMEYYLENNKECDENNRRRKKEFEEVNLNKKSIEEIKYEDDQQYLVDCKSDKYCRCQLCSKKIIPKKAPRVRIMGDITLHLCRVCSLEVKKGITFPNGFKLEKGSKPGFGNDSDLGQPLIYDIIVDHKKGTIAFTEKDGQKYDCL